MGVPIFPAGIVKQYLTPKSFIDNLDLSQFTFEKFGGQTKLRTES